VPGTLSETFFRPEELAVERLTIPAALYNLCRLVLGRIFVDSQAYAVQDGKGGRLICLAWAFRHEVGRDGLAEPAPIELVYYREDSRQLHNRLVGEFRQALEQFAARLREAGCEPHTAKVLPFRR
jgi:hypothetical protein